MNEKRVMWKWGERAGSREHLVAHQFAPFQIFNAHKRIDPIYTFCFTSLKTVKANFSCQFSTFLNPPPAAPVRLAAVLLLQYMRVAICLLLSHHSL